MRLRRQQHRGDGGELLVARERFDGLECKHARDVSLCDLAPILAVADGRGRLSTLSVMSGEDGRLGVGHICTVCHVHEEGEHDERGDTLPHIDDIGRDVHEHDDEPHVCKERGDPGNVEDWKCLDGGLAAVWDGRDAHSRDDEHVEGSRAHDRRRAELARVEARAHNLDDREQDLGRGGAERHQREVGDRPIPHGDCIPAHLA